MRKTENESGPSVALADAGAAMHKGRASSLLLMGGLALGLLGGLVFLVGGDDQARVYGEIGRKVNGLKRATFDQFWGCVLQGVNVSEIKSNSELMAQVGGRAALRGRSYGVYVREKCLPKLERVTPQLETLIVPEDLRIDVSALKQSSDRLRSAFSEYVTYLDDPALAYDERQAQPHLQQIARAWYDFKKVHAALNTSIKLKLK